MKGQHLLIFLTSLLYEHLIDIVLPNMKEKYFNITKTLWTEFAEIAVIHWQSILVVYAHNIAKLPLLINETIRTLLFIKDHGVQPYNNIL